MNKMPQKSKIFKFVLPFKALIRIIIILFVIWIFWNEQKKNKKTNKHKKKHTHTTTNTQTKSAFVVTIKPKDEGLNDGQLKDRVLKGQPVTKGVNTVRLGMDTSAFAGFIDFTKVS